MPITHRSRLLPAAVLLAVFALLAGCGGGSDEPEADDTPSESASPEPTAESPEEPTEEPTEEPSQEPTEEPTEAGGSVSKKDAQAYLVAVGEVGPAFSKFSTDFSEAAGADDYEAVLMSASDLRDAVFAFDTQVRELDLSAIQPSADTLLEVNGQMISQLDEVAAAESRHRRGEPAQLAAVHRVHRGVPEGR